MILFGNHNMAERWNYHYEVQYRNYNAAGDLEQLLLRTGLGYNLSKGNNNVLLGYGYIQSENYTTPEQKQSFIEQRIFQQFISRQQFGRTYLQHRYRFEQRYMAPLWRYRFRYFLAMNIALNNNELLDKTWYASLYNEVFVQPHTPGLDRNRSYVGLGYRFSNELRVEAGYMNQFFERGGRDQVNMVCFLNF